MIAMPVIRRYPYSTGAVKEGQALFPPFYRQGFHQTKNKKITLIQPASQYNPTNTLIFIIIA